MDRVSFDYDGTFSQRKVQDYAKELIKRGVDVWLVTARPDDDNPNNWDNTEIYLAAREVGIPIEKIVFTNLRPKATYFKNNVFIWHLDDSEFELLTMRPYVKGIDVIRDKNWRIKCDSLI